jgi:hypothetical protein
MNAFTRRDVNRATISSGAVHDQAQRSLALLQAIESTVNQVEGDVQILNTITGELQRMVDQLGATTHTTPLDPEGRIETLIHLSGEACERMYQRAIRRRDSARADGNLTDDDGVADCLSRYVAALADFHNAILAFCDTVATLDAMQEPMTGQSYTDVGSLLADLAR